MKPNIPQSNKLFNIKNRYKFIKCLTLVSVTSKYDRKYMHINTNDEVPSKISLTLSRINPDKKMVKILEIKGFFKAINKIIE